MDKLDIKMAKRMIDYMERCDKELSDIYRYPEMYPRKNAHWVIFWEEKNA